MVACCVHVRFKALSTALLDLDRDRDPLTDLAVELGALHRPAELKVAVFFIARLS